MTYYAVVTQAPHYSFQNGGEAADARQYFARPSQRTPNGPRIASAIAGMSPGDFATVWADATGDIFRVRLPSTGSTFDTRDWTPHGVWDATTEQALFGGRRGLTKLTAYSDVTGDWRELQMPADLGRSVNGTVHYYGLIAKDGSGNVYFGNVEALGRTWQFNPVTEEYTRLPDTPTTNGGNGASLSWCTDTGRLARYAGDAQKWMTLEPGVDSSWTTHSTGVGHGAHAIVRYHATHARHLIVGGTSTSTRASLITSDGTVTNVTDVPDTIGMSEGSWVAEHPDGCWLVKTMNAGTNKVYACWPNAGLTDVTWVDLGTAPDTALTYPTLVPYTSSVALIASTTGLYAWALPSVTAPDGIALTGQAATTAAGTLAPSITVVLAGSEATTAAGTIGAGGDVSQSLSGEESTVSAGTVGVTVSASRVLTGQELTTAQGTIAATQAAVVDLTGEAITSAAGTVGVTSSSSQALTGEASTLAAGTVAVSTSASVALTGEASTTVIGTVTPSTGATEALSGSAVTTAAGTLGVASSSTVSLAGEQIVISGGTIAAATPDVTLALSGLTISALLTSIYLEGVWVPVEDENSNLWTAVNDSNANAWTVI